MSPKCSLGLLLATALALATGSLVGARLLLDTPVAPSSDELCITLSFDDAEDDTVSFKASGFCDAAGSAASEAAARSGVPLLGAGFALQQASCEHRTVRTCAWLAAPADELLPKASRVLSLLAGKAAAATVCNRLNYMGAGVGAAATLNGNPWVAAVSDCPPLLFPAPEALRPQPGCAQEAHATPFAVADVISLMPGRSAGALWYCWALQVAEVDPASDEACSRSISLSSVDFLIARTHKSKVTGVMVRRNGQQPTLAKPAWGSGGSSLRVAVDVSIADEEEMPQVCVELAARTSLADVCTQSDLLGASAQPLCWVALSDPTGACCPAYLAQQRQRELPDADPAK